MARGSLSEQETPSHRKAKVSRYGRAVGQGESVAVELPAGLAGLAAVRSACITVLAAVGANRRRLAMRPGAVEIIDTLGRKLRKWKLK